MRKMTRQLAPIKKFSKFGTRERSFTIFNDVELEQLRQAIISDFVNGLDAVGWKFFDEFYHSHDEAKSGCRNWTVEPTPLFDLSDWRNK
jgi:hypothetical protein